MPPALPGDIYLAEAVEFIRGNGAFVGAAVESDQEAGIAGGECPMAGEGGEPARFQVCVTGGLPCGCGAEDMGGEERAGGRRREGDLGVAGEEDDGEEVAGGERLAGLKGECAKAGDSRGAHGFGGIEDEDAVAARFRFGHLKPWCGWWWLRE
jgi:hypothetical protein